MPHPVERLSEKLPSVEPYPDGVVPVPGRLPGTAFFPGGAGLWMPDGGGDPATDLPPMPTGGVMVLGHDFYSEAGFARFVARRGESTRGPTWRNLLSLLGRAGVSPERCFFTNAYMGLRAGSANTGRFPGARDGGFVERCRAFLAEQLRAQMPGVVLTLGSHVPAVISPLSPQLRPWEDRKGIAQLDALGLPLVEGATFHGVAGLRTTVVALVHPSLRQAAVRRRRYGDLTGDAAELAMLRDALRRSGFGNVPQSAEGAEPRHPG